MALPTLFWFTKIGDYAARVVPFVATALAFVAWAYNIVEVLIVGTFNAIASKIASLDTSFLTSADFSAFQWVTTLNAVFPLSESLGLLGALFTYKMVIIAIRWLKSFIPTVAN